LTGLLGPFLTIVATIFVAELTDKDALLLLSLATSRSAKLVFAAGSIAFTITSAVIVLVGSALVAYVPIIWVKVAGGAIMLAYALWSYVRGTSEGRMDGEEKRLLSKGGNRDLYAFLAMLASLMLLDLAGDATELLTIVFVAQYRDLLLVFAGAVTALVVASGVETILGNRLGRILTARGARYLSAAVFLTIGTVVIVTSVFGV
jgi:Ca2+/H+ antiporter, TMEM165/GDT1 family